MDAVRWFVIVVNLVLACWYVREVRKLMAERARLLKSNEAFLAKLRVQVDEACGRTQQEANAIVQSYIRRCKEWAADPWDSRWKNGIIFDDLDDQQRRTH